jgi:lipopolysaccharide/colanic/teichoic acid biosynthesis glycosyltransferase
MSEAHILADVSQEHPQLGVEASGWCHSAAKRAFDLLCAVPVLISALPLMLLIAAVVKLTSEGPVLFRHRRVGVEGKEFSLLKFRTMAHQRREAGPAVTRAGDPRVTPAGRLLRKWKLDELPQLINVVRGEMSLVGPRPDSAEYLDALPSEYRRVLRLRPGITGAATVQLRHEEQLLAEIPPEQLVHFYVGTLLPRKVRLDLEYATRASFRTDMALLFRTFAAIAAPASAHYPG